MEEVLILEYFRVTTTEGGLKENASKGHQTSLKTTSQDWLAVSFQLY